ncbi:SURF1 family protein [Sphingomonas sabuli]|uniref:SURF1-like protein n=1 Tax=Sphingomonas sabuli TaxID=2764186 RepID=A0A7G9KZP7_9SPHN|nr:SURF1 family cytochrome oxidase biogenesis protein [Sphingomonas sabuli]QNM81846.1 SURF1 family protein [Sphingomonas sabuli]
MKKVPIIATVVVVAAVAAMIALGIWQLQRAQWKDSLIAQYRAAETLPPIAFPAMAPGKSLPLFRRATGTCLRPAAHRAIAGANRAGDSGYAHIVHCVTGAEGPGMAVELGWSKDPQAKYQWTGGQVDGIIAPDRQQRIRLVALNAPPGLEPSALPSLDAIPQNHRMYAIQWFAFAAIAALIYGLALRKRWLGR